MHNIASRLPVMRIAVKNTMPVAPLTALPQTTAILSPAAGSLGQTDPVTWVVVIAVSIVDAERHARARRADRVALEMEASPGLASRDPFGDCLADARTPSRPIRESGKSAVKRKGREGHEGHGQHGGLRFFHDMAPGAGRTFRNTAPAPGVSAMKPKRPRRLPGTPLPDAAWSGGVANNSWLNHFIVPLLRSVAATVEAVRRMPQSPPCESRHFRR